MANIYDCSIKSKKKLIREVKKINSGNRTQQGR